MFLFLKTFTKGDGVKSKTFILFKNISLLLIFIILSYYLILKGSAISFGVKSGLALCSNILVPSLFLFTVLSIYILKSGAIYYIGERLSKISLKILGVNGCELSVFIISLIGGYPIGAKLINELYLDGRISKKRAIKLLYCSVNGGPSFIVYTVGGLILKNKTLGLIFLLSNTITSIFFLIVLFAKREKNKLTVKDIYSPTSLSDSLVISVEQTSKMFLNICGWVILFSGITELINSICKNPILSNIAKLFLEITVAITSAPQIGVKVYLYSFLISFGGFSTICQVKSACKSINPNTLFLTLSRFVHGIFASGLTLTFLSLFPTVKSTISNGVLVVSTGLNFNFSSIFLILLGFLYIIYLKQQFFA